MTDAGRKDFSTKAGEKMTPDSSKSTGTQIKESITDTTDKAARGAQPDSSKSTTQEIGDKAGRSKDEHTGNTMGDKVKGALGMDNK